MQAEEEAETGVDPVFLNSAMYENVRFDTIEKMITAFGVPTKFCLSHWTMTKWKDI